LFEFNTAKIQFFLYSVILAQKKFSSLVFSKLQAPDGQKNGKENRFRPAKIADLWQKSQKIDLCTIKKIRFYFCCFITCNKSNIYKIAGGITFLYSVLCTFAVLVCYK